MMAFLQSLLKFSDVGTTITNNSGTNINQIPAMNCLQHTQTMLKATTAVSNTQKIVLNIASTATQLHKQRST